MGSKVTRDLPPSSNLQSSPAPSDPTSLLQAQRKPETLLSDLTQLRDGVLTTEKFEEVIVAIKHRYMDKSAALMQAFRTERRPFLHTDQKQYEAIASQYNITQPQLFLKVYAKTIEEFGFKTDEVDKYNQVHGTDLFFRLLGDFSLDTRKFEREMSLSADNLVAILEERAKVLEERLWSIPDATIEDVYIASWMVEDLTYEQHHIEEDEIQAAVLQYKDDPRVQAVQAKLKALM